MNSKLTVASGNIHKIREIGGILGVPVRGLKDLENPPELIEDGDSFEANARIKARGLWQVTRGWTLADDSGLAVDGLNGAPGVYSARFAGVHGDDAANNRRLLEELEAIPDRSAAFVCVLVLYGPGGKEWIVRGECRGTIAHSLSGEHGFGYDPLFIPEGETQTFAQLGDEVKGKISHRARALQALRTHPERPLDQI